MLQKSKHSEMLAEGKITPSDIPHMPKPQTILLVFQRLNPKRDLTYSGNQGLFKASVETGKV